MRLAILALILCSGCALAPVFKGEYDRNLTEIEASLKDTKGKVADTADVLYQTVVSPKEIAEALAQSHAQQTAEWASEDINLTRPTAGMDIINIILGVLGIGGGLGGFGMLKRIGSLKETVKAVAVLHPDEAKVEAKRRGVHIT